VPARVMIEVSL